MYGTIALDIDGTLTAASHGHLLPRRTVKYLAELAQKGWQLLFITGRSFQMCASILQDLPFAYYLAVQNGAIIMEMPSKRLLSKKYLHRSVIEQMEKICHQEPSDFVIFSGIENNDLSYYRPKRFSAPLLKYLEARMIEFNETWQSVDSYDDVLLQEFPSVKCFGKYELASRLADRIEQEIGLHVPVIRDPFDDRYYVVQATHGEINKGQALKDLVAVVGKKGKVIAAGDDRNDIPLLAGADIKIAMASAPDELLKIADIVAPPANEEGILIGLSSALKW